MSKCEAGVENEIQALGAALLHSATHLGLQLSATQIVLFGRYSDLLLDANRSFNLTSMRTPAAMFQQLFVDSLTLAPVLSEYFAGHTPQSLVDIGSGAGVPGIPLKLLWPEMRLDVVESVGKKSRFMAQVVEQLDLKDVRVWNDRAEVVAAMDEMRDAADVCVARAVAPLDIAIELCAPFVRPGGVVAFPKGQRAHIELAKAENAARALSLGKPRTHVISPEIGVGDHRSVVVYSKVARTPRGFPRRVGIATSQPL